MFYKILPSRKVPQSYLTYKSNLHLSVGQLVKVNIRGGLTLGIVIGSITTDQINFSLDKVKPISEIFNYSLTQSNLKFLKIFSLNTFNNINLCLTSFLQPFKLVTQKQWKNLSELNYEGQFSSEKTPTVKNQSFIQDISITMRIINIIRSIAKSNTSSTLLILFPEKKYLEKIYKDIFSQQAYENLLSSFDILKYAGDSNKNSKNTVWNLISNFNSNKIIFTTRSGIFLPFKNLENIILIDEANNLHIQDQNSIYFDTREASFYLSQSFGANLYFISPLPSVRLSTKY